MRHVVVVFVLGLATSAWADASRSSFLLLRQDERMILVGPPQQTTFEMTCSEPVFSWEGHSSSATFVAVPDGINIEFKLDIIGPDWMFVTLTENGEGLTLCVRHSNGDGTEVQTVDCRSYPNYAGLLEDADRSAFVSALFRRCGQNPLLPDLDCLRTTLFDLAPPADPAMDRQCETLIGRLDDPSWRLRNDASRELSRPGMVQHALAVAHRMNLSPEQRARVDGIAALYRINLQDALVGPLVSLEFPEGDVALASD